VNNLQIKEKFFKLISVTEEDAEGLLQIVQKLLKENHFESKLIELSSD
jgi:uncharacterized protein YihD (DUF1040 family)